MNNSYSLSHLETDLIFPVERQKTLHLSQKSDLVSMRNMKKSDKFQVIPELTLQKLSSIEDDLIKYKTSKHSNVIFELPKGSPKPRIILKKTRQIGVVKKNSNEIMQIASKASQLLGKNLQKPIMLQKQLKNNLNLLISDATKELTRKSTVVKKRF